MTIKLLCLSYLTEISVQSLSVKPSFLRICAPTAVLNQTLCRSRRAPGNVTQPVIKSTVALLCDISTKDDISAILQNLRLSISFFPSYKLL